MPDDTQPKPPTLDYQPVTKSRRGIPTWLVVLLRGFAVGVVWVLAVWCYALNSRDVSEWMVISIYPGQVVCDLLDDRWHFGLREHGAVGIFCFTVGISYGLLALLGYGLHRGLRRWLGGPVA